MKRFHEFVGNLPVRYQPIGPVILFKEIYESLAKVSGLFKRGHTYLGHSEAAAAANKVIESILKSQTIANVNAMGSRLQSGLELALENSTNVGGIRGRGLFRGIEIFADENLKTPSDPVRNIHPKIKKQAMALGKLSYPLGTVDAVRGDRVLSAHPYIIEVEEIDLIVARMAAATDAATAE